MLIGRLINKPIIINDWWSKKWICRHSLYISIETYKETFYLMCLTLYAWTVIAFSMYSLYNDYELYIEDMNKSAL